MDHRARPRRPTDEVQSTLDQVNGRLIHPDFLRQLSSSRLPSQAASDASHSPEESAFPAPEQKPRGPDLHVDEADEAFEHRQLAFSTRVLSADGKVDDPSTSATIDQKFRKQFHQAWASLTTAFTMASERGYSTFDYQHADLVLAVDFNFYGTRMVTASSDHRLKVWDKKDDNWVLVDSWRAHDAEIVDVKWNGPFIGEIVGSIGEDGRFKLWEEDVTEMTNSGRRFRTIAALQSESKVPFMSLDFKNIMTETYAALITRDGLLSVYEPVDHDDLATWKVMMQKYVCPTPPRQEETGFKVCFHKEKLPCWTSVEAGLDKNSLSLAVAAMKVVKVYRTDHNRIFYLAAELSGASDIIRDVAWANGSMRGFDVIATASKDGAVRIYELHAPDNQKALPEHANQATSAPPGRSDQSAEKRSAPSGIGAGLANATSVEHPRDDEQSPGRVKNQVRNVSELNSHHGAVWRVAFSQLGDLLVSTGDDGVVRTWKKAFNNQWLDHAAPSYDFLVRHFEDWALE